MGDASLSTSSSASPPWVQEFSATYAGENTQAYILHGNVHDLVPVVTETGLSYTMLSEFLASQIFGGWESVIYFDQAHGPRALATTPKRLALMNAHIEKYIGSAEELKGLRDPTKVLAVLDKYLEILLLREGADRPATALIFDHANFLVPAGQGPSRDQAGTLTTLLNWARSPYFKRAAFAFCLISERLQDVHESLVENAHTARIEIPFPDLTERRRFIEWLATGHDMRKLSELGASELAELTAGLTLVNLQGLMQRAIRGSQPVTLSALKIYKKRMIESQCQGLVEFVEPKHKLDLLIGQEAAKKRLLEDAELLKNGQLQAVPMGYLLCGSVGTGKTFMAECYAGSVGIPCVKLLNFRSKYVGETEGNLEKVLRVLRVIGPVAVIIDEADAMLGNRSSEGDSGTSSRVFGQFAAQMGDTTYRGRIIWFLLTCRPDRLPIDIKRQGRCEVHIPLFYPEGPNECRDMFVAMGRKAKVEIKPDEIPNLPAKTSFSGADIEGIVTQAYRLTLLRGKKCVTRDELSEILRNFMPSPEGAEKELQMVAAALECTDAAFLPEKFRTEWSTETGRQTLMRRYSELLREAT